MKMFALSIVAIIATLTTRFCYGELQPALGEHLNASRGIFPGTGGGPDPWFVDWPPSHQADDTLWNNLVCKGTNLMKAMQASEADAGQFFSPPKPSIESDWSSTDSLTTWGWHDFWDDYFLHSDFNKEACAGLGLPNKPGRDHATALEVVQWNHYSDESETGPIDEQTYVVGQQTYRSTGGEYRYAINTGVGAIIGMSRHSPAYNGLERNPKVTGAELPQLQRNSDVMWILWRARASDPKKLKYFMSQSIINDETQEVMLRALGGKELERWPGSYFSTSLDADGEQGRALLGTANGLGFGFFLSQHKGTLGNMFISGVRIYFDNLYGQPDMIFYVSPEQPTTANDWNPTKDMAWNQTWDVSWDRNGTSLVRKHIFRANL